MKTKKLLVFALSIVILFGLSEIVNYLSDPASSSSALLNRYYISQSILEAKKTNFESSIKFLSLASNINIFGEFGHYRKLLPVDYKKSMVLNTDKILTTQILGYIANLKESDLVKNEDQGLGNIFYNIALLSYKNNYKELTEAFLKKAMYNNPEFASFHVELINYYMASSMVDRMNSELDYCLKFKGSVPMCNDYKKASIDTGTPREVGFLSDEVKNYYSY